MRISTSEDMAAFIKETLYPNADKMLAIVKEHGKWKRDRLAHMSARWMLRQLIRRIETSDQECHAHIVQKYRKR